MSRWALAVVALVLLDLTAVSVLLPSIRLDLGSSASGAQWVLNSYLLALAALVPALAAAAAALPGRALAVAGGIALAGGAAVCASADSTAMLVAGRAAAGAGAAALLASVAGAWVAAGPRALGTAAILPALALALGPLVGGAFAELDWWRVFFWAGIPLGVLVAVPALFAPAKPPPGEAARALAFAAGLTAVTVALVQAEAWSWGAWALLLLAGAGLLRLAAPREPALRATAWGAMAGCLAALVFLAPEYFDLARSLSSLRGGALLLALTVPAVAGWTLASALPERGRRRPLVLAGLAAAAAGLGLLGTLDARTAYAVVLAGLALAGVGLGVASGALRGGGPPSGAVLDRVVAGAAVGLAAAGAAFQRAQADERAAGASFEQALASGVAWAALSLLLLVAVAAVCAWRLGRDVPG